MSKAEVALGRGTTIPVIDFSDFTSGDSDTHQATATSIRRAFEDFGFLYLRNHRVPQSVVDELFDQSRAFFALPTEAKTRATGYASLGYSGLDPSKPADVKERFRAPYDSNLSPTYWPAELPRFREAAQVFHEVTSSVCRQIMCAIAVSFGLRSDYFDKAHQAHPGAVLLLHYPPISEPLLPGQLRSGAHTDFGTITLLFHYGNSEGLEIQRPDGTWLHAPSLPGAPIVNAGDLLRRWTNGQLRSVLHRVVPPQGPAAQQSRYSAVLFYEPRNDAVITCLEPCQGPDRPTLYPPITAGEHLAARREETVRIGYTH
jgi:isopenicillin N synthase-like dioxygenase